MKNYKLFIFLFLFTSYSLFSQTLITPTQSNVICEDPTDGFATFNLNLITAEILTNVTPSNFQVSYHLSFSQATSNTNPLPSSYTNTINPQTIYARAKNLSTNSVNYITVALRVKSTGTALFHQAISQCDDDQNGFVTFDLTNSVASINTTNSLTVYSNLTDAEAGVNPITNIDSYSIPTSANILNIYVRETIVGTCDNLYFIQLNSNASCDIVSGCNDAESLCNSFGVPFSNTTGVSSSLPIGCLNSVPNPKWFYMPINTSGTINLSITQLGTSTNLLDVDYILFGPFTDPVTPCSNPNLLLSSVVSCSFSASATEVATIPNALAGENYLLLVTNYSNLPGTITITETSNTQGSLDCLGIRMNAFLDINNNGTQEISEINFPLGNFEYEMNNDGVINSIVSPSGFYSFYNQNTSNTYDLNYSVNPDYAALYSVNPSSYSNISIAASGGPQTYNFPVTVLQNYNDLSVTVVPVNSPIPGFIWMNKIVYTNNGNQSINGTISFTNDANVTISSVSQSGTVATANGFTYAFANLNPFETRTFYVYMQVPTPPTVNAGDLFTNSVTVEPFSDEIAENNTSSLTQEVVNSFDPNDKVESHGGQILHSTFTSDDYLYYTIRFENNGTANATNIRVSDLLDSRLDENSLIMVDASHFYTLDRIEGALNWRFNAINLPVSVPNTLIGKGQFTFKIKPKPGYAVGDIIPNAASIYFDFNEPIVTNTFNTEFVSVLENSSFVNESFSMHPNPTDGILTINVNQNSTAIASVEILNVLGKKVFSQKGNHSNSQIVDVSSIQSGIYFVEVTTDSNSKTIKKLIIK
jgi:uncharacterized repeat protein (TIGR01451 family)